MKDDPSIEAIRKARHEISESVGHDPKQLVAHYREFQKQFADRLKRKESSARADADDSAA